MSSLGLLLLAQAALTVAAPAPRAVNAYAPVTTSCPSTPLVRQANGISSAESVYIAQRYQKATAALQSWLQGIDSGFGCHGWSEWTGAKEKRQWGEWSNPPSRAPVIGLTSSGGGYRAQLTGAGVIKGFDARESPNTAVSGLYQAFTYQAGLSGGSWLLSSIIGNNYPTISSLQANLYEPGLLYSLIVPEILVSTAAAPAYNAVEADVQAKGAAGFNTSLIDPWGRLLAYSLLYGPDGGVGDTMSGVAAGSNFTNFNAPYPIITALGSDLLISNTCIPQRNATQYEFHPYEFGSWDAGVDGFVNTKYLGTTFSGGQPVNSRVCVNNFDQLSFILGTSSNVFAATCSAVPANKTADDSSLGVVENLAALDVPNSRFLPETGLFGLYPNPFKNVLTSSHVANQDTLLLVDGGVGIGFQGNPIWPFLHRAIDVLVVNDNSADTIGNFPNGSEIYNTYLAAQAAGLTTMPTIPTPDTFVAQGLNVKPTFFGCNSPNTLTIIYIPNHNYTFQSGQPTARIQYAVNDTIGMIANGVVIANYGGKADWPLCLACGTMKKSGENLPAGCAACFQEYCYN